MPLLMFDLYSICFAKACSCTISSPSFWWTPFASFTSEAYPSCTVSDVRFCFDVHKLMRLDLERYSNYYRLEQHSFSAGWDSRLRFCYVLQAQGDERQTVFCYKGPEGGEDPDQDPSLRSDILLRHLWFWKGTVFCQHDWDRVIA